MGARGNSTSTARGVQSASSTSVVPLPLKARRDIRWLVDDRERLVRPQVGLIQGWNGIGTIRGPELLA
jgi:hypothetical protein